MRENNKGFTAIIIFIVVFVVAFIVGVYYSGTNRKSLNPTPTPSTTPDPTANWERYSGQGISFKYPQEFIILPYQTYGGGNIPEQHFVDANTNSTLWFRVQENINPSSKQPYTNVQDLCGCNNQGTLITLDGQPAARFGNIVLFFNPTKNKQYDFQLDGPNPIDGPNPAPNTQTLNKILSTFQFTK